MEVFAWFLAVILVAGGAFYAGWRSAKAFLVAASDVNGITNSTIRDTKALASHLDKSDRTLSLLAEVTERESKALRMKVERLEDAMVTLFQGFERAGLVRSQTQGVPRQVGETREE